MNDDDVLREAKEAFRLAADYEQENRNLAEADLRFARLGDQWDDDVLRQRREDGRPALTINRMPTFIRQVVNDARLNKPSMKVRPVDGGADVETAQVINGLIRNIEQTSNADVAYDTAADFAVTMGFGYFRIDVDFANDDTFDQDIRIERVANPFNVYGDPYSEAADSSDWNSAFLVKMLSKDNFERKYKGAAKVDWELTGYTKLDHSWFDGEQVMVAEYWTREEKPRTILKMSDGSVVGADVYDMARDSFEMAGFKVMASRVVKSHAITHRLMTGMEVLETTDWPGRYIPLVPVYGEEVNVTGERFFRSLIRDAVDAQRMINYWRHLALDTPLPTPSGWTTMGEVHVGDELFDETGEPCRVIGKSPVKIRLDCFQVNFDDGSHIVASDSHVWRVEERGKRTSVGETWTTKEVTTAELTPKKHFIKVAGPLDCDERDLSVNPFLLGLWLGDGDTACGRVTPGDEDIDEIRDILTDLGYRCGVVTQSGGRHGTFTVLGLGLLLRALGVLGNKHIPAAYLRASREQRWQLLQGFMDSDGSISSANRQCSFTTTNEKIAAGFAELLRSLGIKAVSLRREGRNSKLVGGDTVLRELTQFSFSAYPDEPVFRLDRKRAVLSRPTKYEHRRRTKRHRITSVDKVDSVPVQCVAIDAPSRLFLAGEAMVPTHNTASTELVALAPKAPWIGPEIAFTGKDSRKWETANTEAHAFLAYAGQVPPQRQPFASVPAGALQEALNASDDMKSIMGLHDASLGARSNETSGRAIMARQREGDVSTFHFLDNLSRAIRHGGRIVLDLIPHVYSGQRIIRTLGQDGATEDAQLGQPAQPGEKKQGFAGVYDLTAGKYDLTVEAGPSFTTQRQEAAEQMMELLRVFPQAAPVIGDLLVKNLDWPGADDIAERLKSILPPELQGEDGDQDPRLAQAAQAVKQLQDMVKQLEGKLREVMGDQAVDQFQAAVKAYDAETKRMKVLADADAADVKAINPKGPYDRFEGGQAVGFK